MSKHQDLGCTATFVHGRIKFSLYMVPPCRFLVLHQVHLGKIIVNSSKAKEIPVNMVSKFWEWTANRPICACPACQMLLVKRLIQGLVSGGILSLSVGEVSSPLRPGSNGLGSFVGASGARS